MWFCVKEPPPSSNMLASSGRLRLRPLVPLLCWRHPPRDIEWPDQHQVVARAFSCGPDETAVISERLTAKNSSSPTSRISPEYKHAVIATKIQKRYSGGAICP